MSIQQHRPPLRSVDHDARLRTATESGLSLETTLAAVQANLNGLTDAEALSRLTEYGPNEVARDKPAHALIQLALAFKNPFIAVLMVLAAVSAVTDILLPMRSGEDTDYTGVLIIVIMVTLSGLLRFWQEYRSGKAAQALKAMVRTTASVQRRSSVSSTSILREIPMSQIVPGDIVRLSAGDMIPADLRLIESRDLFVSQAALTGEALPVEKYDVFSAVSSKSATASSAQDGVLEQNNMCFMGTNVVSGTATAVVVATGAKTYFGSLAKAIVGSRAETSFDRGVNSVSWLLIRFMLVMVPIVLLINGFSKGDWTEAFLFALAVAVGLTPEMLPMIVSSNLAKGAVAMAKNKVVVKRLNAIQNFGAMDVLCTDKTGTLTQDRIILEHHLGLDDRNSPRILELALLNSLHQSGVKNLMDQAVLRFAEKTPAARQAIGSYRKIDELPFDFIRRRLSVVVQDTQGDQLMVCKGAVEEMLSIATHVQDGGQRLPLDTEQRARLFKLAHRYNSDGFRVLLIATRTIPADQAKSRYETQDEQGMTVQGLLTFLDPPKESAAQAIAALTEHGVAVKVLTGDNEIITAKICREVGLEPGTPLLGPEIEAMQEPDLRCAVERHSVFAKLTPLQKSRVLKALQANGHTVGFLGDGINDAPALRDADVGISVDSGTDIAKESADIILLEKSLLVLEEGVIKGRETFGNIIKYLNMTASSNFGNVFSVLVASAFIPFLPMLAIHLLIQNLLYDISQLALPWDRMDKDFLRKPRKWDAKNIGRFMIWIGPTSSIFDISTFMVMWYVFGANTPELQSLFQSGWFIEGLLSQTLVVHMLRTQKIPFIQSTAALPVMLMTVLIAAVGIYLPFSGVGAMVGLQPLPWEYFPWLVGTLFAYCLVAQGMKMLYIRRFGQWF